MNIVRYQKKYASAIKELCDALARKYAYDNHVPGWILEHKNFKGFLALENQVVVGFVGVMCMPGYNFPFGLRVHPNFFSRGVGSSLSLHVDSYALETSSVLRSVYLLDHYVMRRVVNKEKWYVIGQFLITKKDYIREKNIRHAISSYVAFACPEDLKEIFRFIKKSQLGLPAYDSMFSVDGIWYPVFCSDIFMELIEKRRLLIFCDFAKNILSVAVIGPTEYGDAVTIFRIWGDAVPAISFFEQNYHPRLFFWHVSSAEEKNARLLGFITTTAQFNKKFYESRYALIEKIRKT